MADGADATPTVCKASQSVRQGTGRGRDTPHAAIQTRTTPSALQVVGCSVDLRALR